MRRYVVGAVADATGGAHILLSVDSVPLDLRDAVEACREKNERHRRIWPDTNVAYVVYTLREVPSFVAAAASAPLPEALAVMSAEFERYLESSETLGQDECSCGHSGAWHLHGPETWGECDAEGCECGMYLTELDSAWWYRSGPNPHFPDQST